MQILITKQRAALAVLFVLAGVGLGSLLSPLVGTALATVGQVVNISDHSASAYFAKVDSSGALHTVGTVSGGNVSISAPQSAFSFTGINQSNGVLTGQFAATNATLAFTGFRIAEVNSEPITVYVYQLGESSTTCDPSYTTSRFLGTFEVPGYDTVDEQLTTPQVLKPFGGKPYWCLALDADGGGGGFYATYSGYGVSGSFTPPVSAPPPGKARVMTRQDR
jgi:hypothetical protein